MSGRKVLIDLETVCDGTGRGGIRSYGKVFSSMVEMLTCRADILNCRDRALVKMYLNNGLTFRQISDVVGSSESVICRRINKLTAKLIDNDYITCLRNRDKFKRIELELARDYYIEGFSQKRIAEKHGMTLYSTRKVLRKIRGIIDSCGKQRSSNSKRKTPIKNPTQSSRLKAKEG